MRRDIACGNRLSTMAVVWASLYFASQSNANNYTFAFTGVVTSVDSLLLPQFKPGYTVHGSYTFTDEVIDADPQAEIGVYLNPFIAGSASFSNGYVTSFNPSLLAGNSFHIENKPAYDNYQAYVGASGPSINGATPTDFTVLIDDFSGLLLSSDAIPTSPPNIALARMSSGDLRFLQGSTSSYVNYSVQTLTLVPEPPTLLLLAISAIGLLGYRNAKSR